MYVTELADNRVSVFSPDLAFVRAFGADVVPGNQQTGFEVCTTASGCKRGSNGAVFGRPGTRRNLAGVLNQPAGVVIGANGRLFVSEAAGDRVSVFSRAPAFLRAFGKDVVPDNAETGFEECTSVCAAGRGGAGSGELDGPVLMTVDCRGALYVAEELNGRVQKFGRPGTADPPCGGAAALAKPFGIMKVRRNTRSGTATLTIHVPWSSELQLRGRGIKPVTKQVEFRRTARLTLRPTRAAMGRLERLGHTPVRATVTYWPWGGEKRTKTRKLELRLQSAPR